MSEITLASTTVADHLGEMLEGLAEARAEGADLLLFPAQSCRGEDLPRLRTYANQ